MILASRFEHTHPWHWVLLAVALFAPLASAQDAQAPGGQYQDRSVEELQGIVGPFALYPDELVRYILPASTHPEDMLAAAEILTQTHDEPKETDPDVAKLHESVQALLPFPDVIHQFAEYPDWLVELGDAVAFQEADVMDAIQEFRRRAHEAGNLETTPQQTVVVEQQVIRVIATNPEVIYVPVYQPATVVVQQPSPALTFGLGVAVGALVWGHYHWGYWGGCSWSRKTTINIDGNVYRRPPGYRPGYRPPPRPGYRPGIPGGGPGVRPPVARPYTAARPVTPRSRGTRGSPSTVARPSPARPSTARPTPTTRPASGGAFGGTRQGATARSYGNRGASSRRAARPSAGRRRGRV